MPLSPMLTVAGIIELVAGILIVIGVFTRPAAFVASGMAAAGYWLVHGSQGFYPIANGGETILLFCFLFLYIATRGAGRSEEHTSELQSLMSHSYAGFGLKKKKKTNS